jgi:hypothetical protein
LRASGVDVIEQRLCAQRLHTDDHAEPVPAGLQDHGFGGVGIVVSDALV